MSRTVWLCQGCGIRSAVDMKQSIGAYEGVTMLRDSHNRVSPSCPKNLQQIVGGRATKGETADAMALPFVADPQYPEMRE